MKESFSPEQESHDIDGRNDAVLRLDELRKQLKDGKISKQDFRAREKEILGEIDSLEDRL